MKILEKKYPRGTYKYQKTAGRYIERYLYDNIKGLAEVIHKDMTFLGIGFSSTLEVGTGKSVLFTQIGEAWTSIINELHGTDITFTQKNIVFRPKDLIKRSFEVPKYSCIIVDEWEDAHYWSELAMTLRKFFRKCRQLNLFILVIIPNFFQLPINYALGRSVFAIDIKFKGQFERGYFNFYDFESKRALYIKGKKTHNYYVAKPSFSGEFEDGYGIPEDEYRKAKREDMEKIEYEEEVKPILSEFNIKIQLMRKLFDHKELINKKGFNHKVVGFIFDMDERTSRQWIQKAKERDFQEVRNLERGSSYNKYTLNN